MVRMNLDLGKFREDFGKALVELGLLEVVPLEQGVKVLQRYCSHVIEEGDLEARQKPLFRRT